MTTTINPLRLKEDEKSYSLRISSIAEIILGYTLRGHDDNDAPSSGITEFPFLKISDISPQGIIELPKSSSICLPVEVASRHLIKAGDLVIPNRGTRITAALFDLDLPVVAGSQFFIIRPKPEVLDSGYLLWFLQLESTRRQLLSDSTGTHFPALPASVIRALLVPVPDLKTQRTIGEIHQLRLQESRLIRQLEDKRDQLLSALLQQVVGVA